MSFLRQYEEAIDVFEIALRACPDDLWRASMWTVPSTDPWVWPRDGVEPVPKRTVESIQVFSTVWNRAAHCVFFLDFYLSGPHLDGFRPPHPFEGELDEVFEDDGAVAIPTRVYAQSEVLAYLAHGRAKAVTIIPALTEADTKLLIPNDHPWGGQTYNTLLRVNLKHVKEHGSQVRLFLERGSR